MKAARQLKTAKSLFRLPCSRNTTLRRGKNVTLVARPKPRAPPVRIAFLAVSGSEGGACRKNTSGIKMRIRTRDDKTKNGSVETRVRASQTCKKHNIVN